MREREEVREKEREREKKKRERVAGFFSRTLDWICRKLDARGGS